MFPSFDEKNRGGGDIIKISVMLEIKFLFGGDAKKDLPHKSSYFFFLKPNGAALKKKI